MKSEYNKLSINRIKAKFFSSGHPMSTMAKGFSSMALPKTPWGMINHLFKRSSIKFDYCHMTSQEMLSFLHVAKKEKGDIQYPLTMIGHSKEFINDKEFASFLDVAIGSEQVRFRTMGETVKTIEEKQI